MYCEGKLELRSHNTRCCLIEVVTKAGFTVLLFSVFQISKINNKCPNNAVSKV